MSRAENLHRRLDALESSFRDRLEPLLQVCAAGKSDMLFWASEYLPRHFGLRAWAEADELLALADEIHGLRNLLAEPFVGSLAWRYRECCREAMDLSDHHRGTTATIASQLLQEMRAASR